jgi:hypothetical protein
MPVFDEMSKGERNRVKVRVRSAMAAQAEIEGRFLGGRPPYGYMIVDAGPHPTRPRPTDVSCIGPVILDDISGTGRTMIAEGDITHRYGCLTGQVNYARPPDGVAVGYPR